MRGGRGGRSAMGLASGAATKLAGSAAAHHVPAAELSGAIFLVLDGALPVERPGIVHGGDRLFLTGCADPAVCAALFAAGAQPDRKSTRLNSSHVAISYAVFCFNKKTEL